MVAVITVVIYFHCLYYNNDLKTSILHEIDDKSLIPGGEPKCTCSIGNCY